MVAWGIESQSGMCPLPRNCGGGPCANEPDMVEAVLDGDALQMNYRDWVPGVRG